MSGAHPRHLPPPCSLTPGSLYSQTRPQTLGQELPERFLSIASSFGTPIPCVSHIRHPHLKDGERLRSNLSSAEISAHRDSQRLQFSHSFSHPGVPGVPSLALRSHDGHFNIYSLPRSLHCKDGKIQCGPWVSLLSGKRGVL